jgi:DNA-binding HxlR family transcriptional regulator
MPRKLAVDSILSQSVQRTNKKSDKSIIHNLHGFSQDSPKKVGKLYQLKKLITQGKLTESLEVLEKSGISGDFALFMIQNIQLLEVA